MLGSVSVEEVLAKAMGTSGMAAPDLNLPSALTEQDLLKELKIIAKKNATVDDYISFLGGGSYNHYMPSAVRFITSRSEFSTPYTPYQPEVSQGTLQAIFEYQTMICQLTGMEISNASMYDGASATAEAVLMAARITKRRNVFVSSVLHPEYRATINTYTRELGLDIHEVTFCTETGRTPAGAVEAKIGEEPACILIQQPNFLGCIEDLQAISGLIHERGGLLVVAVTEPVSLGLIKPPGEYGADIVVGEGQGLGNHLSYGGPYLGFLASLKRYARQVPGRFVGETVDTAGKRGYCLTLATREQHIRREKATSNICTNEGLCALSAAVFMSLYGRLGFMELARLNLSKAEYLKMGLSQLPGVSVAFNSPTFNEFVIRLEAAPHDLLKHLLQKGIFPGISLSRFYPELSRHILVCVTEMNSKEEMDTLVEEISKL